MFAVKSISIYYIRMYICAHVCIHLGFLMLDICTQYTHTYVPPAELEISLEAAETMKCCNMLC